MAIRDVKYFFIALLVLTCSGCVGARGEAVLRDIEAGPERGVFIKGVPRFKQERYRCGPAALASVLNYYGKNINADDVAKKVFQERLKGSLAVDMLIYAKEAGFNARYYKSGIADLKENITAERPLILFLNLGIRAFPRGHYIVAVGYDDNLGAVLAYTGSGRLDALKYKTLMRAWEKTGFSAMLITPKGRS